MSEYEISLESATGDKRQVIANMYPLFIHDQWAYSDSQPNQYGIIDSALNSKGRPAQSLAEQAEEISPYWEAAANHHPFLIRVNNSPAGFCLVKTAPLAPDSRDFYLDEFFLLHPFRRQGVGSQVVKLLVSNRPGNWVLEMKARNKPAHAFWTKVILEISSNRMEETQFQNEYGPAIRMKFSIQYPG